MFIHSRKPSLRGFRSLFSHTLLTALLLLPLSAAWAIANPETVEEPTTSETGPVANNPEKRFSEGGTPKEDPVCPAGGFQNGGYGSRGGVAISNYEGWCVGLDPKYVNADGTLNTQRLDNDRQRHTREDSWTFHNMVHRHREKIDFWAVAYFFDGSKFAGTNFYKLCGCFRDYADNGCFHPDTKITMADGSTKVIQDIEAGESVLNPVSGKAVRIKQIIQGPEALPLVKVKAGTTELLMSSTHPVPLFTDSELSAQPVALSNAQPQISRRLVQAQSLVQGDKIMLHDGTITTITSVSRPEIEERQQVYNLVLDADLESIDEHLLISEGIVTGDWALQNRLARQLAH